MVMKPKLRMLPVGDLLLEDDHNMDGSNVQALKLSMENEGLLHPLVVHPNMYIKHGRHRHRAALELGWVEIACIVVPPASTLEESAAKTIAENIVRRQYKKPERDRMIARLVELRVARNGIAKDQESLSTACPKTPGRPTSPARAEIKSVAKETGVSERTAGRAVKDHAPELLAGRATSMPPLLLDELGDELDEELGERYTQVRDALDAAGEMLKRAQVVLSALVNKHDLPSPIIKLRGDVADLAKRMHLITPATACSWCGGEGGKCCDGFGLMSRFDVEQAEKGS